jgi:hypothetical protein
MGANTERERLERVLLGQAALLQDVHDMLADEQRRDDVLRATVRTSRNPAAVQVPDAHPDRVYSLGEIRAACVKHRLRFLEGALYKGDLPGQAVLGMRRLERLAGHAVTGYMVLAPSAQFRLCDSEVDPLLFVPMGDDRFYLVARWGSDLAPWRAWVYWPVRRPLHLTLVLLMAALVFAMAMPAELLGDAGKPWLNAQRLLLLFWSTMVISGFALFGWFAFFGQFSKDAWNSRYFN